MRIILSTRTAAGAVVALAVLGPVLTGGCSGGSDDGRIRVVAAENFWGDIAAQVAGPGIDVESIVTKPDADPHDYEPTAQDARDFAGARLVIENGIGYDPWAQRLLDADPGHDRVVLDVGKLLDVPDGGNPHRWYSRGAVSTYVREVARDLASIDPSHREAYARRADSFESTAMAGYDQWVRRIRSQFGGTAIGASESIVSLWADTLGLKLLTPESFVDAVSEGNEPTATDKATVDAQIRDHEIKVFVFNSQNSTPDVQRLVDEAHAAHIPVVTITETLSPEQASFQDWQAREAHALYDALVEAER